MLSVDEALSLVLERAAPKAAASVDLDDALGQVLAEDIASDIDSPPHDKAMMDGYAVVAADLAGGAAELAIAEEVTAGQVPTVAIASGQATRIMTGAPIPAGADAVVMVERTELVGPARVRVDDPKLTVGTNIMPRATSLRVGQRVLAAGTSIRHIEIGVLAEVGRVTVPVIPCPRVAVLPTGDELVPASHTPAAGQIRNSNGPMLAAAARRAGADAFELDVARDEESAMHALVEEGLKRDVLLLSGGVSAGVKDLVPSVLADLGIEQVFHKVSLKPGKPLWFGYRDDTGSRTLVFGLPGNPVSSLVCFELFVRPALAKLAGIVAGGLKRCTALLTSSFHHRGDRPTYHPARLVANGDRDRVELIRWQGSSDLAAVANADALAIFEAGDKNFSAGAEVETLLL